MSRDQTVSARQERRRAEARMEIMGTVASDAKMGIAVVALEAMSTQMGMSPHAVLVRLFALYFPEALAKFARRLEASLQPGRPEPSRRLKKIMSGYGHDYDPETRQFAKHVSPILTP